MSTTSQHKGNRRASAVAALVVLLAWAPASAQLADIHGIVADSTTGERIPFATVMVVGTPRGTSTNLAGFYLLAGLPPGAHRIAVSSVGHRRSVLEVALREGESVTLDVKLSEEAVEAGEVVVTGRRMRELREVQTSVQMMDQRDLKLVPAAAQEDVFRSIQILPGIVSTSDVTSQFYVRGGAGDQNLILLDGMRIYNPYHALGIFSLFDTDIIKSAEVYSGAFPAGYGDRLSSVVALSTREGRSTGPAVRVGANLLSAKVQAEGPLSERVRLFVNARRSISPRTLSRFVHHDVPVSFYDVFAKATLAGMENASRYAGLAFLSGDDLWTGEPSQSAYTWRNRVVGVTGSGLIDRKLFVNTVVYESDFVVERDPRSSGETPARSTVRDFTIRAEGTLYFDSGMNYLMGFEFSFPSFEYSLVNSAGSRVRLLGAEANVATWHRFQITAGRWMFDAGAHVDATALLTGTSRYWFQPRVNVSLALFEDWRVKVSVGRITQNAVTVNNEDDLITLFDAWIPVPENLEPERADHVVVGIGGSVVGALGFDAQAYLKDFGGLVAYNRDKLIPSDPDYIGGSGRSSGVELLLRYEHSLGELQSSYSIGWATVQNGAARYHPRYDRRHSFKSLLLLHPMPLLDVSVRWDVGSGLPFTPTLAYYSRIPFADDFRSPRLDEPGDPYIALGEKNSFRLPAYHRLDAAVSYRWSIGPFSVGFGGSVANIYDRKNVFYFDRRTGKRVNSLAFFPSVLLTVDYK